MADAFSFSSPASAQGSLSRSREALSFFLKELSLVSSWVSREPHSSVSCGTESRSPANAEAPCSLVVRAIALSAGSGRRCSGSRVWRRNECPPGDTKNGWVSIPLETAQDRNRALHLRLADETPAGKRSRAGVVSNSSGIVESRCATTTKLSGRATLQHVRRHRPSALPARRGGIRDDITN